MYEQIRELRDIFSTPVDTEPFFEIVEKHKIYLLGRLRYSYLALPLLQAAVKLVKKTSALSTYCVLEFCFIALQKKILNNSEYDTSNIIWFLIKKIENQFRCLSSSCDT